MSNLFIEAVTGALRQYLISDQDFKFHRVADIVLPSIKKIGIYIHIPFCKNLCPYCPYNKVKYDKRLVQPYLEAVLSEIEQYHDRTGKLEITSVYIGGGTPTNLTAELGIILEKLRKQFHITGDICIETNPNDLNQDIIGQLVSYGVSMVSLGVQSFNNKHLALLGRNYTTGELFHAIDLLQSANLKSVNLDLMFALPTQSAADLIADLNYAVNTNCNQVTTYPLFTFPFSTVGRYKKIRKVKMPNLVLRQRMYRIIHEFFVDHEFDRSSVWSFTRNDAPRYSSVTRDYYIGLGAGAGSHVPGQYYFNTFSVKHYIKQCQNNQLPVALQMNLTDLMSSYYWLYWRFYDTFIPKEKLPQLFKENLSRIKLITSFLKFLRMIEDSEDCIRLTRQGAFWIHLLQNYYALNYINKIYTAAGDQPFPDTVNL